MGSFNQAEIWWQKVKCQSRWSCKHLTDIDLLETATYPCRNMTNYPRYYQRTWRSSPPHMDSLVISTRNWNIPLKYTGNFIHGALLATTSISLPKPIWHFGIFGPIYLIRSSVSCTRHYPTTDCQVNCIYIQVEFADTHLGMPPGIYRRHNVRSKLWWLARTCNLHCA